MDLARWNADQGAAWNRLRTSLRKAYPGLDYFRSVEVQTLSRDALHLHVLIRGDQVLDVGRLHALALAAGFGCVLDLQEVRSASSAAWYVSKYVSKSVDQRDRVPWFREKVSRVTGEVVPSFQPTYRAYSTSQTWGVSMRDIRAAVARSIAAARAASVPPSLVAVPQLLEDLVPVDGGPAPPA